MERDKLIAKITEKKEFSRLPKKDVEMIFNKFDKPNYLDEEKIKLTRDLLRKVYSVFTSQKLLKLKDKEAEWILKKHISTKERFEFYKEVYFKIFSKVKKDISIFDLGAGVNGFSYGYLPKGTEYVGVEAMGQLVELMNYYFKEKFLDKKANAIQESLFDLNKIKNILKKGKNYKVVFLFKVLDSLEMVYPDYSKRLLLGITGLCDKVVVSFATRSLVKRTKFKVDRGWIFKFINQNFKVLDDFEIGTEKYIVFSKK